MKTREETARFIERQLGCFKYKCKLEKGNQHHYGKQELRELMDFIYDGEPTEEREKIVFSDGLTELERVSEQTEPRFKHDCDKCVFLGRTTVITSQKCIFHDLYFCNWLGFTTVIARYGDGGDQYISGLEKSDYPNIWPDLAEAKRRAVLAGLINE